MTHTYTASHTNTEREESLAESTEKHAAVNLAEVWFKQKLHALHSPGKHARKHDNDYEKHKSMGIISFEAFSMPPRMPRIIIR